MPAYPFQVGAARDGRNFVPCRRKFCGQVPSHGPGAEDADAHLPAILPLV
jgi:hypothetical protein